MMICSSCASKIPEGEDHEYNHKILCEDCYIEVMSPAKFCDPWATYNAQSFAANNPEKVLTENQKKIIEVLKETRGADPDMLTEKLRGQVSAGDGERECAALHRMGKISFTKKGDTVFISLK